MEVIEKKLIGDVCLLVRTIPHLAENLSKQRASGSRFDNNTDHTAISHDEHVEQLMGDTERDLVGVVTLNENFIFVVEPDSTVDVVLQALHLLVVDHCVVECLSVECLSVDTTGKKCSL